MWRDLGSTLGGWAVGLAMASAIALPLGIALGSNALLYRSLRFLIEFLRPIPAVALIPIVVLVSGTGFESKLFLVTFASIWPLLIQTISGLRIGDPRDEVLGAWLAKESVRDVYLTDEPAEAATLVDKAIAGCAEEIRSLGRTLVAWRTEILAHHDTGASNGPTEGLNSASSV